MRQLILTLTPLIILALAIPRATFAQSLVGFWEAEDTATATVGTDGTLINGAGFAPGRFGQGFSLDGSNGQFVEIPGGGGLNNVTEGTISMWVQWNGTQDSGFGGTAGAVLARQSNGVFSDNIIGLNNTDPDVGNLIWQPYGSPAPVVITGGTPPGDGNFRHVAVTFSDGHHALYLDGVLQGTATTEGSTNDALAVPLTIGAWAGDGAAFSTSVVDDVAIFSRELSIGQIQALASGSDRPLDVIDPIEGVTATGSSFLFGGPPAFDRSPANTVDGVGRGTEVPDGAAGEGNGMWLTEGIGFNAGNDTDPQITFDLGEVTAIGEMVVYNYNEILPGRTDLLNRGVQEAEILISDDGINFTSLGTEMFQIAPGNGSNPGRVVDLDVMARFVQLDIISNFNGADYTTGVTGADFGFVGLNEVEFFAPTRVIPEPGTFTVLTVALMGLSTRRRRK